MFNVTIKELEHIPNVPGLPVVTLADILSGMEKSTAENSNIGPRAFLDGIAVPFTQEEQRTFRKARVPHDLIALGKSVRVTNVQLLVPHLKEVCDNFFREYGLALTVNFYFTPNEHSQCFDFHSDAQYTHVQQLFGEKKWVFLERQGTLISEKTVTQNVLTMAHRNFSAHKERHVMLRPGDMLRFPYTFIHRAQNLLPVPSGHLTYSHNRPTIGEFGHFLVKTFQLGELPKDYSRPCSAAELRKSFSRLQGRSEELLGKYEEYFRQQELRKTLEGRSYD